MIRRRANEQHIDWIRQLDGPPRPYRPVEADPALQSHREETRLVFGHPELTRQPPEQQLYAPPPEAALMRKYSGTLGSVDVEPYGTIAVEHGDIFAADAEAVILPMTPNLMPYRGLALEALDRGGKELVKETFTEARDECARMSTELLQAGDTVLVSGRGVTAQKILFVIMPWFWQGSPLDAGKRLRDCVHRALLRAGSPGGFASVALPHIGGGVFGYEPLMSSAVMMEEAMEALMQIEAQVPCYKLQRITFVEDRLETAEALSGALTEVSHRWLPDRQLTTAAQYWGSATRRLVVLPDAPNFFWKLHRVKFKKHHGVKRKWRRNYIGNVKPLLWRAMRVHQPPPLKVFKESGDIAPHHLQSPGRPYFFRGVTHWLFPSRRTGFQMLRKSSKGHWVGKLQRYRLTSAVRPKM